MTKIHGYKKVISERSGILSPSSWKYAVSFCGLKDQIGDWDIAFTKDLAQVTCKKCLNSIRRINDK